MEAIIGHSKGISRFLTQVVSVAYASRLLSAALIPLTVAPFAAGSLNPMMDATLCFAILIHSHIGFEYEFSLIHVVKLRSIMTADLS